MKPGDLFLAFFPYGNAAVRKMRPVLLLKPPVGPVPELLVAYVTSVMPTAVLPSDIIIDPAKPEHSRTRLKTVSIIRLHKQATIHQSSLVRFFGRVSRGTHKEVKDRLRILLNL